MLFRGTKAKDMPKFQHLAAKDTKQFERTIRDPKVDIYACVVNFIGQSKLEQPNVA